jgi:membrane carboxypeptidase/penicillin-binding protein
VRYSGDLRRYAEIQRAGKQGHGRRAVSQEQQNGVVPQPQLEQANQSLVAQSGAQEYAPHVINTPLSFLIKSALNTNIFGEPGWQGTGWRAGRDLQRHDIGGKTGTTNSSKDAWFSGYGPGVVTSVWIGFDDHRRDLVVPPHPARLKIRSPATKAARRARSRPGMLT